MKRKEELEELLQEFEQRLDDGEAQIAAAAAEKKKLMTNVQDLEEQCVLSLTSIFPFTQLCLLQRGHSLEIHNRFSDYRD